MKSSRVPSPTVFIIFSLTRLDHPQTSITSSLLCQPQLSVESNPSPSFTDGSNTATSTRGSRDHEHPKKEERKMGKCLVGPPFPSQLPFVMPYYMRQPHDASRLHDEPASARLPSDSKLSEIASRMQHSPDLPRSRSLTVLASGHGGFVSSNLPHLGHRLIIGNYSKSRHSR